MHVSKWCTKGSKVQAATNVCQGTQHTSTCPMYKPELYSKPPHPSFTLLRPCTIPVTAANVGALTRAPEHDGFGLASAKKGASTT